MPVSACASLTSHGYLPSIVNDDVYLALAKLRGLLYQHLDVFRIKHITWYRDCSSSILVDGICHYFGLCYPHVSICL